MSLILPETTDDGITARAQELAAPALRLALMRFILELRHRGITDHALVSAFEDIDRARFLPRAYMMFAYEDRLLPIASGQVAESPFTLASMLATLQIDTKHHVLEIGTGTGYSTTILARLARRVISLERSNHLLRWAKTRLDSENIPNASFIHADGLSGYENHAPYDRIFVSGAVEIAPKSILDQLAEGGRCIMPIGSANQRCMLWLYTRRHGQIQETPLAPIRLAMLQPGTMRAI